MPVLSWSQLGQPHPRGPVPMGPKQNQQIPWKDAGWLPLWQNESRQWMEFDGGKFKKKKFRFTCLTTRQLMSRWVFCKVFACQNKAVPRLKFKVSMRSVEATSPTTGDLIWNLRTIILPSEFSMYNCDNRIKLTLCLCCVVIFTYIFIWKERIWIQLFIYCRVFFFNWEIKL